MKKLFLNYFLSLTLLLLYNNAHAGGMIFPIEINKIDSISKKEHHLHFKLLEKVGNDTFSYPLDDCETVTLKITFQEWKFKHKVSLFFDNLFHPMLNIDYLNRQIESLKEHINKPMAMSDVEAFYYHPENHCELFSKTLQLQYGTVRINNKDYKSILQPIRHDSDPATKPKNN